MYHKRKVRVYLAWMLFMTFLTFFVVKTFHYHGSEGDASCSHAQQQSHHHSDDCAICKYSLSLFTEPQSIEFHGILTLIPYELIIFQDKIVCKRTYSHQLRAPPVT